MPPAPVVAPAHNVSVPVAHKGEGVAVMLATVGESFTVTAGEITWLLAHPAPGKVTVKL